MPIPPRDPTLLTPPAIETPCVGVCKIDLRSKLCIGCRRTIDEIARWASLSSDERRRIMDGLDARANPRC